MLISLQIITGRLEMNKAQKRKEVLVTSMNDFERKYFPNAYEEKQSEKKDLPAIVETSTLMRTIRQIMK
jgi:hypothetical protein